ncbi:unnamed protein product [Citrullus colocynthis]|uniref:Uncharacterized protein n=1 Tax=Citrullus colocynthis TaxID=252529 RepID=A0ABP0XNV0_9ROSI
MPDLHESGRSLSQQIWWWVAGLHFFGAVDFRFCWSKRRLERGRRCRRRSCEGLGFWSPLQEIFTPLLSADDFRQRWGRLPKTSCSGSGCRRDLPPRLAAARSCLCRREERD